METVNYGRHKFYDTGPWVSIDSTSFSLHAEYGRNKLECLSLTSNSCLKLWNALAYLIHLSYEENEVL
jgi:hypothetical protein